MEYEKPDRQVFLVVEPVALIAEDLAESIVECHPDALVLRAASAVAALAVLAGSRRVTAAFVHLDPHGFADTALGATLADRGARMIFMGSRADAAPEGTLLRLRSPFDTDSVQMMLESLRELFVNGQAPGAMPGA